MPFLGVEPNPQCINHSCPGSPAKGSTYIVAALAKVDIIMGVGDGVLYKHWSEAHGRMGGDAP